MASVDEEIIPPLPPSAASKRKELQSNPMKITSEWIFSQQLPSDITVQVMDATFSLHEAHPSLSDIEKTKVCSLMDCQKLSRESPVVSYKMTTYNNGYQNQMDDKLSKLRAENSDLKLELAKMRMQLKELQKQPVQNSTQSKRPPLQKKSFIESISKKLGRLNSFVMEPFRGKVRTKPPKNRRHSM